MFFFLNQQKMVELKTCKGRKSDVLNEKKKKRDGALHPLKGRDEEELSRMKTFSCIVKRKKEDEKE